MAEQFIDLVDGEATWWVECADCLEEIDGDVCHHCNKCGTPICEACFEKNGGTCDECHTGES